MIIFTHLKDIFILALPLILLHAHFQFFYKMSLLSVVFWWCRYGFNIEDKVFYFIALFFSLFILLAAMGTIVQMVTLSFNGETHNLIYAGNSAEKMAVLYHENDLDTEPVEYFNLAQPVTSFNSVYKIIEFSKDKGTERIGAPSENYSFGSVFTLIWIVIALLPIMFGVWHAFVYPVTVNAELNDFDTFGMKEAFEAVFAPYNITIKHMAIYSCSMLFSLFIIIPLFNHLSSQLTSKKEWFLPAHIKPHAIMSALPVNSFHEVSRQTSTTSGHMSNQDTGFRYTIFKFEKEFKIPAYVAYRYHYKNHLDFENLSLSHIKYGIPMKLKILDDLSIQPLFPKE